MDERLRFASGSTLLAFASSGDVATAGRRRTPSIVVDVIRPSDLVAFTVEGHHLELVDGRHPYLRPMDSGRSLLVYRLGYQHLGERAIYEGIVLVPNEDDPTGPPVPDPNGADGPAASHKPPIEALPARGSRIVVEVPADATVPFTTEGLLTALEQFPMAVHPLARPRAGRTLVDVADGLIYHLPGGLVALIRGTDLVVSKPPRGVTPPDPTTTAGLSAIARDTRTVRDLLTTTSGVTTAKAIAAGSVLGRGRLVRIERNVRVRPRPEFSRDSDELETAIEAPFRLVISPSVRNGWTHATTPVGATDAPHRIEMWHTRLGVRAEPADPEEPVVVDERSDRQRAVRAVWARDRERYPNWQASDGGPTHADLGPFRMSLDAADRHILVRQSAETWLGKNAAPITPEPVDVEALWLSALGAWLDVHGNWQTLPYSEVQLASILSWDHVAPVGRDQYVRVVYPGYLFPFGHQCTLVKVTERKMKDASPSIAGLYQRKFLVVGERVRTYTGRDTPFTQVTLDPLITPTLSPDPSTAPFHDGQGQDKYFFPNVNGSRFPFTLHCLDREGRKVKLSAPLLWVSEGFSAPADFTEVENFWLNDPTASFIPVGGQDIAFAPVAKGGDTLLPTTTVHFEGDASLGTSVPSLLDADVDLPAVERLSPIGGVNIAFDDAYLNHGFGGADNVGEVWAKLTTFPPKLSFGGDVGSDKAGGFVKPDLEIEGLSRSKGTVGDLARTATGDFDPTDFLGNAFPKLFGLIPFEELLDAFGVDLSDAPNVVSEALDRIEGFLADLERAKQAGLDAIADTGQVLAAAQQKADKLIAEGRQALADELVATAQTAVDTATALSAQIQAAVDDVIAAFGSLAGAELPDVDAALSAPLTSLSAAVAAMRSAAPQLPPLVGKQLLTLADVLEDILAAADLIEDVVRFVNGLATSSVEARFRYEWRPKIKSWPSAAEPLLEVKERSLVIAVDGRASGKGEMGVEVLAEIKDFTLHLFAKEPLVRFKFDHLSFRSGSSGKTEVDVVLNDIEFVGILSFVETIKDLIPFDGFSDPPYVDVSPAGLEAGFTLALPNVAIGVFNLSNMSLGADIQVPFLGDVVSVGFNFCTRERPFNLSILFLGGGGWFLLRLSPNGLEVLEVGLEAGAMLSVDFGVASGSISAAIGVYIRLEGEDGSLTAYFRLRGEVDVLGLISASIELYLALTYDFPTGKLIGEATLTIKVEVFVFSGSVTIRAERRFAGSNGDPNFLDIMGMQPDGTSAEWSRYCRAFAGV